MKDVAAIEELGGGWYWVPSASQPGSGYRVNPEIPQCGCKGFEIRGGCRHLNELASLANGVDKAEVDSLPPIFTTRYANQLLAEADVVPVRTSLGAPKFAIAYELEARADMLAPPHGIFKIEKREEFERRYRDHLNKVGVTRILKAFKALAAANGNRPLALLCFEDVTKRGEWCHRRMFAQWFKERTGKEIPELHPEEMCRLYGKPGLMITNDGEERLF